MAKMRIHELAKELGVQSKEITGYLEKEGLGEKYPTSSNALEEQDLKKVTAHFQGGQAKQAADAPKAAESVKAESAPKAAAASKEAASPKAAESMKAESAPKAAESVKAESTAKAAQSVKAEGPSKAAENVKAAAGSSKAAHAPRTANTPGETAATKAANSPKAANPQKEAKSGEAAERPKKKSNVTAVFNPQNSRDGSSRQKSRVYNAQDGNRRRRAPGEKSGRQQRPQNGQRRPAPAKSDAQAAAERSARYRRDLEKKEAAQRAARGGAPAARETAGGAADAAAGKADERAAAATQRAEEAAASKAESSAAQSAPAKSSAQTRPSAGSTAEPARRKPAKDSRESGRQADRSGSNRGREDAGRDRGKKSTRDDRAERRQGGDRNGSYERGTKADRSVQKGGQGNRSDGDRRSGSRNAGKNKPGYQKEQRSTDNRGQKRVEGGSASDGRGRNDRNKSKKKNDYNKKNNTKNQERYVNLEKKTGFKKKNAAPQTAQEKAAKEEIRSIKVPEYITIRDLADLMKVNASEVIKTLFLQGTILTVNQEVDYEKAEEIALQFNCIAEPEEKVDVIAELLAEEEENEADMVARPPVVCVMGHVDHGKTSLLDCIRKTHVTEREAGGITQHIGASVARIGGRTITFLDTPGHEAFTAMRMRGANSTDIAILVVAADDGIMPQTIEAINHAKAAGIEIIVAINKIDKPNANVDKVKQGLAEKELVPEDWGGSTICVPVSAKTGEGIDELLEMVLLTADVLELKANPKRKARGLVIEAKLDKGRGAVATVLVQKGTLKAGDPVAAGDCYGKVRAMSDHAGKRVREAGPSMPVEIFGLSSVPGAGEVLMSFDSEKEAKNFANTFISMDKERLLEETRARRNLDDIFSQIQAGDLQELDLIIKADVQGSAEAVKQSMEKISNEEVVVKVIHAAVGNVTESDVNLATASNAIIIGFNVKVDNVAKSIADHENVDIRLYSVIYQAIDDVENAMKGMLAPIYEERVIGHAEVRQLFKASGVGTIAGSYVLDGVIERGCRVRVSRGDELLHDGELASLKRFKDDVKEVKTGFECGLVISGFNDIEVEDVVEAYKVVEVPRS